MSNQNKKFISISKQLLKVVFTFYFSITIVITIIHFAIEYYHTQDSIKSELQKISLTFKPSLVQSVWNFDDNQVESIMNGVLKLPTVLGVDIYDKKTKEILFSKYDKNLDLKDPSLLIANEDLKYIKNNKSQYIGTVRYYSNANVVFDRVKVGFFIIFINSLIKSLILTVLFIWAFKKYLTIPLEDITNKIKNIQLDKISQHKQIVINSNTNNELTYLSSAFNKMLKNLNEQLKKLKEAQEHLVQSENMVALGNMVAGVAHEINTPIGMALTGITHLKDETNQIEQLYRSENMSEEDFEKYLETNNEINRSIQINLQKSADLIKSFKMVAVDQSSGAIRTINTKEYINDILLSLHNKLKQTKIKVHLTSPDDLNITINAGAISQIITNLIMNTIIHGFKPDEEGDIFITIQKIDNTLELIYKDTGIGISKEVKARLFDPFFTTKRSQGGSGLGTSIIYNLVTTGLQGTIKVTSELHKGMQYDIIIPLKKGEQK